MAFQFDALFSVTAEVILCPINLMNRLCYASSRQILFGQSDTLYRVAAVLCTVVSQRSTNAPRTTYRQLAASHRSTGSPHHTNGGWPTAALHGALLGGGHHTRTAAYFCQCVALLRRLSIDP